MTNPGLQDPAPKERLTIRRKPNCPNCAGTGISLNPNVYNSWGNPRSGVAPLTAPCECTQEEESE
jgi:hypothetical protein